jgi:hypothetical protein
MSAINRVTEAGFSNSPSGLQPLTLPIEQQSDHTPPTETETDPKFSAQGAQYWLIAFVAGLVALWLIRKGSGYLQGSAIAVNAFNFLTIFLMAALGFLIMKIILSIYPLPGLTALVHAL